MLKKLFAYKGEQHKNSKLTTEQVKYIRHVYNTTDKLPYGCATSLASEFNISVQHLSVIARGKVWKGI